MTARPRTEPCQRWRSKPRQAAQSRSPLWGGVAAPPLIALAPLRSPQPVPPEFSGKARALINRFAHQDRPLRVQMAALFQPLKHRMEVAPKQRREDLAAAVRALDLLPTYGLLVHTRDWDRSRRLLDDWRLTLASGAFSKAGWINNSLQPSLLIVMLTLKIVPKKASLHCDIIGIIGLHAAARFFQRSLVSDEAALLDDLKDLALHYDVLLEQSKPRPHRWRHATTNGVWVGDVVKYENRLLVSASSFHGSDFD